MQPLRAILFRNRPWAVFLLIAALWMKGFVPDGFMVDGGARTITIQICADATGQSLTRQLVLPNANPNADHGKKQDRASPCHFTALGHGLIGAADPWVLALALAFVLLLGFAPVRAAPSSRWRFASPPLRGPPLPA